MKGATAVPQRQLHPKRWRPSLFHGPSGFFDEFIGDLVPRPGPRWISEKAAPRPVVVLADGLEAAELKWRQILVKLIPERDSLLSFAREAEADMKRSPMVDWPGSATESGSVAIAVRRAVWANLGSAVRAVLSSLDAEEDEVAQTWAAQGAFPEAKPSDYCTDVESLAVAIDKAWAAAAYDPEALWAAQVLLGECGRVA